MRTFSKKLRKIMEESGHTPEEFAKRTKVSRSTLYNFLNGRLPTLKYILNLVEFDSNIDLNWLLKEKNYLQKDVTSVVREAQPESNDYIQLLEKALEGLKKINKH